MAQNASLTIRIEGMPEVLAAMRAEFARIVRDLAADEAPDVAARLHEIAWRMETGVDEP